MTPRQRKFAQKYVELGMVEAAAVAAGYSERTGGVTGSRLLRNAAVVEEIRRLTEAAEKGAAMDREKALKILIDQAEDSELCARDRQKAIELLARLNGWYAPSKSEANNKTEIEVSIADSRFLRSLDAEEERRKLERRQAAIDAAPDAAADQDDGTD